jgi:hypothetical protein
VTFEEYTRHIDWSLTVGRRRTRQTARQAASTARRRRDFAAAMENAVFLGPDVIHGSGS